MKVIVGLIEHIGDIIACEPVSRYLRLRYPNAELSWAVSKPYRSLIDINPNIDQTIVLECLTDWIKLSKHKDYDLVVDLHVNYRICQHCRVSLIKESGNPFINAYEWFDYGSILEAFSQGAGLPKLSAPPRMYIPQEVADRAASFVPSLPYCVIHRDSSTVEKDWLPDKWIALCKWIGETFNIDVVEVGTSKGGAPSIGIPGTIDLRDKTSLFETAEIIRRSALFIGVDSGPAHMANAVGALGVLLLGKLSVFRKYNPFSGRFADDGDGAKIVRNLNGMTRDISVEEVKEAVAYVWNMSKISAPHESSVTPTASAVGAADRDLPPGSPLFDRSWDRDLLRESRLFDSAWYVLHNPDAEGHDALDHYLAHGAATLAKPSAFFDPTAYVAAYPDVLAAGVNPLLHYLKQGIREGRSNASLEAVRHSDRTRAQIKSEPIWRESDVTRSNVPYAEVPDDFPRIFAFYLPQFHPIAENDWAHGAGFTEWTNVVKTKPLFRGHYQPRIPGELGYYDLRSVDVMREQIRLATEHGIEGFCFYYYYFNGKKLLYKPIDNYIKSDISAPFFFLWANENWSKRWDGGDREVIIGQSHSPEDDIAFLRELVPTFSDERYVKVGGKPILMVYKAHLFADARRTAEVWRDEIVKHGFPGIYLVLVDDWGPDPAHPRALGFDASYEIPSNIVHENVLSDDLDDLDIPDEFTGRIVDYRKFAAFHMGRPFPPYRRHRTVMLPWDNTPRYGMRAMVHINAENDAYRNWLMQALLDTFRRHPPEERIVFLHSWNEWCEGTYVEPDGRSGRRYLEETRATVNDLKELLALGVSGDGAYALSKLMTAMDAKDEGVFRILQASRLQWSRQQEEIESLRKELLTLEARNLVEARRYTSIVESRSWRLTRGLRALARRLRG